MLTTYLVDAIGFIVNPYDDCVANKVINGQQCTIAWYVDDLKISHAVELVVDQIFEKLESQFGQEAPLTVTRGKVHTYLGMNIDYSEDGKVKFSMPHLTKEIIQQLPEKNAHWPINHSCC